MHSSSRFSAPPRPAAARRRQRGLGLALAVILGIGHAASGIAGTAGTAPGAPSAGPTAPAAAPPPAATAATPAAPLDAAGLEKGIGGVALDPGRSVAIKHLTLSAGPARVELGEGVLIPATELGGRTIEMVFVGAGQATLDPPDPIEAGQLDLFTSRSRLDESFTAAVLVLGMDQAAASMLRRPAATPTAAQLAAAKDLFAVWKKRERRVMGVEGRILGRAAGDPSLAGYFAALCRGARLGDFLYVFDPHSREQVTLGRFVPIDPTAKEKRKLLDQLAREQRKGHDLGLELEEIGTWDTWVAATTHDAKGQPLPGAAAFEPRLYDLDASLGRDLRLTGRARIELVPQVEGARTVRLSLGRDLVVSRVSLDPATGGAAGSLTFHRAGDDLTVLLPRAFAKGEVLGLVVEYAGVVIDETEGLYVLRDTFGWYPHAGEVDRARYQATFHWPHNLTLLASGRHLANGNGADGRPWERRAIDRPSLGVSFEIGKYKLLTEQAGHVRITLAVDTAGKYLLDVDERDQIIKTVRDSLVYYEAAFGPYPFDELAVVTTLHPFSQGSMGMVTLSDIMMYDLGAAATLAYGVPDRRAIVAHEVAHQWWGDTVGWASYRDQWISEALASYCAMRYMTDAKVIDPGLDLAPHWRRNLAETIADGRSVESVGPVVLGSRLLSSLSSDAYSTIVYDKGEVVLKTLEATLGTDEFLHALAKVYKQNADQTLSTAELVSQLGALTHTDLAAFAEQFIYGTALQTLFYAYRFEPQPGGTYKVIGTTRQEAPHQYRYRIVSTPGGAFDVRHEAIPDPRQAAGAPLPAPAEIEFVDPAQKPARKGAANATMHGRLWVQGTSSDFAIEVHGEPKAFYFNRHEEVFANFFDETRHPRQSLLVAAHIAADRDQAAEAETLLGKALATDDKEESVPWLASRVVSTGSGGFRATHVQHDHAQTQRWLTVEIQLSRARLFLQQGRDEDAKAALDAAGAAADYGLDDERDLLLSWLDIHRARFDSAFHRLRDSSLDTAESTLFLAIAAQATSHREELETALKAARRKGADSSALQPAAAGKPAPEHTTAPSGP